MFIYKRSNILKIAALFVITANAGHAVAQTCRNQYPCSDCAVYDNNGNDLAGFIKTNKRELMNRGAVVNDYSSNNWGYIQVRTTKVPSVVSRRGETRGELNYTDYIRATLVLHKTKDGANVTWWGRECNIANGPLSYIPTKKELEFENIRYSQITNELENKKFALVEYYDTMYNTRDYDYLLKNYILVSGNEIKNTDEYKVIIDFYNAFLDKFTEVDDPILGNKSFITFFKSNNNKYIGYFNVVNGKLAGKLDVLNLQYEKDKEIVTTKTFKKLKGNMVYVYGDETFGMDKEIIKYARTNHIRLKRWNTAITKKFNEDKP
jgi:hypothetical protein